MFYVGVASNMVTQEALKDKVFKKCFRKSNISDVSVIWQLSQYMGYNSDSVRNTYGKFHQISMAYFQNIANFLQTKLTIIFFFSRSGENKFSISKDSPDLKNC